MTTALETKIHILGLGSMGTVLAVDLLRFTNATIIPLFRSKERLNRFQTEGNNTIGIRQLYKKDTPLVTYRIDEGECPESFKEKHIKNLVVTTKTYQTSNALKPYLPYIDSNTNLILIQNGLGVLEVLKETIFTDKTNRPQLFQAVIAHGVYLDKGFVYNHAGWAPVKIARLPWENDHVIQTIKEAETDARENELISLLNSDPFRENFGIQHMTYQELVVGQLGKFFVNACINPVTAIMDSVNGEIVDDCKEIFTLIVEECLEIFKLSYPQIFNYQENYKGIEDYPVLDLGAISNPAEIVQQVIHIGCVVNAKNSSSMRQDSVYLRDTEIEYINGYIVKLASKHNMEAKVNQSIQALVNLRLGLNRRRSIVGDWRK